ncbi:DUF4097 family beta strand repeat-containing protein [Mesonia aestuariivivens]|uniref:Adhesin domain-containing protein n=1 Tax=Mesonia aestuariivivens TaxID=2796128 RepID=A0ABS6VXK5_9FLAO|nr:hypothetical protein [Mesonia aestuariivivens]MBW2960323.1 hypothetical protein [Mesonia aestuariivivens]
MNFKYIFLIVIVLSGFISNAQREALKTFSAKGLQKIEFAADEIFKIEVKTIPAVKQVQIFTFSEGEYFNDIAVIVKRDLKTLKIASTYKERLTSGYDKLSAHKVYAVNLKIILPEGLKFMVISNIANVYAAGKFEHFEAELKSGDVQLKAFTGKALINTFTGNVHIETTQANLEANTNHGQLYMSPSLDFGNLIEVKSIYGDIEVRKIQ